MKHSYIPLNRVLTNFFPCDLSFRRSLYFPNEFPQLHPNTRPNSKKKKEKMSNAPIRQDEKPPKLWKELITRL